MTNLQTKRAMRKYINIGKYLIYILPGILTALIYTRCAPSTTIVRYSHFRRQIVHADSLFRTGNYEIAKMEYTKIRDKCKESEIAATAQYRLGYINIYYDNPFADYEAALREFKRFQSMYPKHEKIEQVQNWIRMLTVLTNFARDFNGNIRELKNLGTQREDIIKNYTTLQEAYLRCDSIRDSLINEVKALERLIIKLQDIK